MLRKVITLATLLALASTASAATGKKDHTGWYVGGSLGSLEVDAKQDNLIDIPALEPFFKFNLANDTSTTASIEVYGGYNFTDYFGLEMSLMDSGDVGENGDTAYYLPINVTPTFTWQINDTFALYGKLGLNISTYMKEMDEFSYDNSTIMWAGIGGTAGIGTDISLTRRLNLKIGYDYSETKMSSDTDTYIYWNLFMGTFVHQKVEDITVKTNRFSVGLHAQF